MNLIKKKNQTFAIVAYSFCYLLSRFCCHLCFLLFSTRFSFNLFINPFRFLFFFSLLFSSVFFLPISSLFFFLIAWFLFHSFSVQRDGGRKKQQQNDNFIISQILNYFLFISSKEASQNFSNFNQILHIYFTTFISWAEVAYFLIS